MSDHRTLDNDIVHGVDDPRLLEAMEENAAYALADISRSFGGERYHGPDMTRYISGAPIHFLNGVISARFSEDQLDATIEKALEPFKARSAPMMWIIGPSSSPNNLGARLETFGLTKGGETPCMAMNIAAIPPLTVPPSVTFFQVTDEASVEQFAQTVADGFEFGAEAVPIFQQITVHACLPPNPQWVYHLGLLDGQPVATCTTSCMLGWLASIRSAPFPKRDDAALAALSPQFALLYAATLGYRVSTLQATPMGFPVYRRLGFRDMRPVP